MVYEQLHNVHVCEMYRLLEGVAMLPTNCQGLVIKRCRRYDLRAGIGSIFSQRCHVINQLLVDETLW